MTSGATSCPPASTRAATRATAISGELSHRYTTVTKYPCSCAVSTVLMRDRVARVVSMQKSSRLENRYCSFLSMYRLAVIYAVSGWNGAKLFANSSEFTNSLQSNSSGSSV